MEMLNPFDSCDMDKIAVTNRNAMRCASYVLWLPEEMRGSNLVIGSFCLGDEASSAAVKLTKGI